MADEKRPKDEVTGRAESEAEYRSESVREEAAGLGERMKGAAKEATGSVLGIDRLEREGARERAEGRAQQADNEVIGGGDRTSVSWMADRADRLFITGLYDSPESAARAYDELTTRHGYRAEEISIVMSDETRRRFFGDATPGEELKRPTKAAEGAGIGAGIGMGVGAALGALLAAASSIALPGLGLVIAGPIAGAIAGAGAGGAAGSLVGLLIGMGIPEQRAEEYERGIREGGIVLGARARDDQHGDELERDFNRYGARDIMR
jgi:uncharacterized protein YjbJ (UPF0337 family)